MWLSTSKIETSSRYLNLTGMNFPVKLKDIVLFEKVSDIYINVYRLENNFKNGKIIMKSLVL